MALGLIMRRRGARMIGVLWMDRRGVVGWGILRVEGILRAGGIKHRVGGFNGCFALVVELLDNMKTGLVTGLEVWKNKV